MKNIRFSTVRLFIRPSCVATFGTIYGIGKLKASRLNNFLLNHPLQREFQGDFVSLMYKGAGRNIINRLFIDKKIRLLVSLALQAKILSYSYQGFRIFQNLPLHGQRTKCNAGTARRLNPYLSLGLNLSFYRALTVSYKRRELFHNERYDELKALKQS
jgi:ribosomal protein S13